MIYDTMKFKNCGSESAATTKGESDKLTKALNASCATLYPIPSASLPRQEVKKHARADPDKAALHLSAHHSPSPPH
jgi:hypothetical protein